jgi:hypothetical protein
VLGGLAETHPGQVSVGAGVRYKTDLGRYGGPGFAGQLALGRAGRGQGVLRLLAHRAAKVEPKKVALVECASCRRGSVREDMFSKHGLQFCSMGCLRKGRDR